MIKYILEQDWITLRSGPYAGIKYKYGKVKFDIQNKDTPDEYLKCTFKYVLHPKSPEIIETQSFIDHLGMVLFELIEKGLVKNSIVYTGGTDEA